MHKKSRTYLMRSAFLFLIPPQYWAFLLINDRLEWAIMYSNRMGISQLKFRRYCQ